MWIIVINPFIGDDEVMLVPSWDKGKKRKGFKKIISTFFSVVSIFSFLKTVFK